MTSKERTLNRISHGDTLFQVGLMALHFEWGSKRDIKMLPSH
jgi:hypothetical protein